MHYTNPVLSGFYPDPSVCRVGDWFYLVNSTFAYLPGIPVHRSRDLVNWELISHVIDRNDQLSFEGAGISRGLFAPSIRFNKGTFYVTCTNIDNGGNFYVTATDPAGPWSDPVWLPDAIGIDPSVFFDDDGSAWYVGTRPAPEGCAYSGNWEVWVQRLDVEKKCLVGETYSLWRGALRDCVWPEGPHVYKINGMYYLLIAEGGTGPDHAVSIARSPALTGPWEGFRKNPVLTHRHLGKSAQVVNVGHADLVDDSSGNWFMVLLASRPMQGYSLLGRETFIAPVRWEDGWPCIDTPDGLLAESGEVPDSIASHDSFLPLPACEHFDGSVLPRGFLGLRTPAEPVYSLSERPGFLRLRHLPGTLHGTAPVSFIGRRQEHHSWVIRSLFEVSSRKEGDTAGLALLQAEDWHYRLEFAVAGKERVLRLMCAEGSSDRLIAECPLPFSRDENCRLELACRCDGLSLSFFWSLPGGTARCLASKIDASVLSTERAGGFVGTVLGVFASSNGEPSTAVTDVDWFEYRPI